MVIILSVQPQYSNLVNMGSAESVPRERQQQKSSRLDLEALQEKYDGFRITEDRETDSMIVERNVGYQNGGPNNHVQCYRDQLLIPIQITVTQHAKLTSRAPKPKP